MCLGRRGQGGGSRQRAVLGSRKGKNPELPKPLPEPPGPNCSTFCQPRKARLPQGLQDGAGSPLMPSTILAVAHFGHRLPQGLPGWQSLQLRTSTPCTAAAAGAEAEGSPTSCATSPRTHKTIRKKW